MKKCIAIILSAMMLLSLAACGGSSSGSAAAAEEKKAFLLSGARIFQRTIPANSTRPAAAPMRKIMLISGGNKTLLDESNISVLDTAEIACADIVIRPYNWEVNGNSGTKAYVKSMYITLQDDDFGGKYAD